jgi:hypothetical protein
MGSCILFPQLPDREMTEINNYSFTIPQEMTSSRVRQTTRATDRGRGSRKREGVGEKRGGKGGESERVRYTIQRR